MTILEGDDLVILTRALWVNARDADLFYAMAVSTALVHGTPYARMIAERAFADSESVDIHIQDIKNLIEQHRTTITRTHKTDRRTRTRTRLPRRR